MNQRWAKFFEHLNNENLGAKLPNCNVCCMVDENGRRCAIGSMLTDGEIEEAKKLFNNNIPTSVNQYTWEKISQDLKMNINDLGNFQNMHDEIFKSDKPEENVGWLAGIAEILAEESETT